MSRRLPPPNPGLLARARATGGVLEKWAIVRGLQPPPQGLTLPRFIGIGAQKAGTTWLDRNLRRIPGIYLPAHKELHYFDRWYFRRLRNYARHFEAAGDRLPGEITPSYSVLPMERIRLMHAVMPDARLILLLRNPIDRAWSHLLMHLLRRQRHSFDSLTVDQMLAHLKKPGCYERGCYLRMLHRWESVFPPEQLLVGFFEDLTLRPQGLLQDVLDHIGFTGEVTWDTLPYQKLVNKAPDLPMPLPIRAFLEEQFQDELAGLRERFVGPVQGWE